VITQIVPTDSNLISNHVPPTNEIISHIFNYLDDGICRPKSWYSGSDKPTKIASLVTVCRTWTAFGEALLYRNLRLDYGARERTKARLQLFNNLQDTSRFCRYVQCLEIVLPQVCVDEEVVEIIHLLRKATGFAKQVKISQENNGSPDPRLISAIVLMRLETLVVAGCWLQPIYDHLLRWGDGDALKALRMEDCHQSYYCHQNDPSIHWAASTDYILPEDRQFSSSLQTIVIVECDFHIKALYELLRWPATLKVLKFLGMVPRRYSKSYGAVSIQPLLDLHAQTLETIGVVCYSSYVSSGGLPNLSNFSSLRNLTVSHADLFADTPRVACSKLPGSALTHLTIDTGHGQFDAENARWLTQFAGWRHNGSRPIGLLYVHVAIQSNDKSSHSGFCPGSLDKKFQSSVQYLSGVRSVAAEYGVHLTWDKIYLTEAEKWIQQTGQVRYGGDASQQINQYAEEKAEEQQTCKT